MAEKSTPNIWGLATESDIDTVFRESEIGLTYQDAAMVYTAAINSFASPPDADGLIGLTDEAVFNGQGRSLLAAKRRVAEAGEGESIDFRYESGGSERWYRIRVEPVGRDGGAGGPGLLSASIDITRQKTAEEHLRLALLELAHRSKNLLAVVLSLARQSADDSRDLEDFRGRFLGRIRALALAHDILTEEAWRGATVFSLVRSQLAAFGDDLAERCAIDGHNAFLKPNAVQYVGLALHELIAHSILSGALADPNGRVAVESRVRTEESGEQVLCLAWEEVGETRGGAESTSEFGQALLRTIVPAALGGHADLKWKTNGGLTYVLHIPTAQFF
jgi:two-component sensor histidine kinase